MVHIDHADTFSDYIDRKHLSELGITRNESSLDLYEVEIFVIIEQTFKEKEHKELKKIQRKR